METSVKNKIPGVDTSILVLVDGIPAASGFGISGKNFKDGNTVLFYSNGTHLFAPASSADFTNDGDVIATRAFSRRVTSEFLHNNLVSIQGGKSGEYFHLNSAQHTLISSTYNSPVIIGSVSATSALSAIVSSSNSVLINDGGTLKFISVPESSLLGRGTSGIVATQLNNFSVVTADDHGVPKSVSIGVNSFVGRTASGLVKSIAFSDIPNFLKLDGTSEMDGDIDFNGHNAININGLKTASSAVFEVGTNKVYLSASAITKKTIISSVEDTNAASITLGGGFVDLGLSHLKARAIKSDYMFYINSDHVNINVKGVDLLESGTANGKFYLRTYNYEAVNDDDLATIKDINDAISSSGTASGLVAGMMLVAQQVGANVSIKSAGNITTAGNDIVIYENGTTSQNNTTFRHSGTLVKKVSGEYTLESELNAIALTISSKKNPIGSNLSDSSWATVAAGYIATGSYVTGVETRLGHTSVVIGEISLVTVPTTPFLSVGGSVGIYSNENGSGIATGLAFSGSSTMTAVSGFWNSNIVTTSQLVSGKRLLFQFLYGNATGAAPTKIAMAYHQLGTTASDTGFMQMRSLVLSGDHAEGSFSTSDGLHFGASGAIYRDSGKTRIKTVFGTASENSTFDIGTNIFAMFKTSGGTPYYLFEANIGATTEARFNVKLCDVATSDGLGSTTNMSGMVQVSNVFRTYVGGFMIRGIAEQYDTLMVHGMKMTVRESTGLLPLISTTSGLAPYIWMTPTALKLGLFLRPAGDNVSDSEPALSVVKFTSSVTSAVTARATVDYGLDDYEDNDDLLVASRGWVRATTNYSKITGSPGLTAYDFDIFGGVNKLVTLNTHTVTTPGSTKPISISASGTPKTRFIGKSFQLVVRGLSDTTKVVLSAGTGVTLLCGADADLWLTVANGTGCGVFSFTIVGVASGKYEIVFAKTRTGA